MRTMIAVIVACLFIQFQAFASDEREGHLEVFFQDLASAAESGDTEAYANLFSPEASLFIPNRPPLLGRKRIGQFFDTLTAKVTINLQTYEQVRTDIVGDVAMVRSRATGLYIVDSTGEQIPFVQKYLDILQYDGRRWQLSYHVASNASDQPGLWDRAWETE